MKTRTLISVLFLISIFVMTAPVSFEGGSKKEELYGTWINEEYKDTTPPFEIEVYNPDGTYESFRTEVAPWEKDVEILEGGWIRDAFRTYKIEDKWIDSEGNVWYKVEAITGGYEKRPYKVCLLMKISDSNRILEYMYGKGEYYEEIDPSKVPYTYRIYYRLE